jgi:hypothetical protein
VPGASWNSISTPSMVCVSPVALTSRVGTIRAISPTDVFCPSPQPTCPRGRHGRTGVHVLLHGMLGEALGRDHDHLACVDVGLVGHAEHAAEVVDVAVGVDNGADGPISPVRPVHGQRRRCGLGGDQRVDHDDAGVALDEADVGKVETANLVDALDHLVETLLGGQRGLAPQARVHRRRCVPAEEVIDVVVPHHPSVGGRDDAGCQRVDEAAVGVGEVTGVVEGQIIQMLGVRGVDDSGGWLLLHARKPATASTRGAVERRTAHRNPRWPSCTCNGADACGRWASRG